MNVSLLFGIILGALSPTPCPASRIDDFFDDGSESFLCPENLIQQANLALQPSVNDAPRHVRAFLGGTINVRIVFIPQKTIDCQKLKPSLAVSQVFLGRADDLTYEQVRLFPGLDLTTTLDNFNAYNACSGRNGSKSIKENETFFFEETVKIPYYFPTPLRGYFTFKLMNIKEDETVACFDKILVDVM